MNLTWSVVALATAALALSGPSSVANARTPIGTGELSSAAVTGRDIAIVPSAPEVSNCFPFANNTGSGFTGFIYRNVPAFQLRVGDAISFDLGALNHSRMRRDIYLAAADKNPGPAEGVGNTVSQG